MDSVTATTLRGTPKAVVLVVLGAVLAALVLVGFSVGSGDYTIADSWRALFGDADATTLQVIRENRVPRTILAVVLGAALAVAGAVMQGLTRNPLADPGILGVNSGAYFAMVIGAVFLGVTGTTGYVVLGLVGALVASVLVYFVGSRGVGGASPAKLVLTGVAIASICSGIGFGLTMIHPKSFDTIRGWQVGTLDGRGWDELSVVWLPILLGLLLAVALVAYLNALALGDDRARGLGVPVTTVRALGFISITILCGTATAAAGPITFLGLMVPHAVRALFGPDNRWVIPVSVLVGPALLVGADVLARILTSSELPVGMVMAFIGAPVLIMLIRREKGSDL